MLQSKLGKVLNITSEDESIQNIKVEIEGKEERAVNYIELSGKLVCGDIVLLNTTAVTLGLGTGGVHFVICNMNSPEVEPNWNGHIMKLRYTPLQIKCNTLEEQEQYNDIFNSKDSLDGMPVCVATLHSMVAPIICNIRAEAKDSDKLNICYIMTDGAAIPMGFSKLIKEFKAKKLINSTITIGHAFGGDYECINIYSALIAAKHILHADIVVVSMGPGIVGSNTKFGFTGVEQAHILDAVKKLNGIPIAVPRVSFSDKRDRHFGLSHQSATIFSKLINSNINIVFSKNLHQDKLAVINNQLDENLITKFHNVVFSNEDTKKSLDFYNVRVSTMGRNFEQDKEFFITAGASGFYAAKLLSGSLD
jgi:hypothetical protein